MKKKKTPYDEVRRWHYAALRICPDFDRRGDCLVLVKLATCMLPALRDFFTPKRFHVGSVLVVSRCEEERGV